MPDRHCADGADAVLRSAADVPLATLVGAFNAGYSEYVIPMSIDAAAFESMIREFSIDLHRSLVLSVAGEDSVGAGVGLLGRRGAAAWVGGLGVAPRFRRRGHGRRLLLGLLENAEAAGADEITLEVISTNDAAVALYEAVGFRHRRLLRVWSLPGGSAAATRDEATETSGEDAWTKIKSLRGGAPDLPWQRQDAAVAQALPTLRGLATAHAAAVYRTRGSTASLVQLAAVDSPAASALLGHLAREFDKVVFVNVPDGDVAAEALRELGADAELVQYEMVYSPSPAGHAAASSR
jgi:ribosomal protein S18 acetylase RimI-like enzyme